MQENHNRANLFQLKEGESARVCGLLSTGAMRRRLQDLGIVEGTRVQCAQRSPSGDPTAYAVRGAVIALRREDAEKILTGDLPSPPLSPGGTRDATTGEPLSDFQDLRGAAAC